jgi:hypothetical protein
VSSKLLPKEEWDSIKEDRAAMVKGFISGKWMRYGEYLTVEFDTDDGTATVVPNAEGG